MNPFRPTFGASPHHWAGRRQILDDFAAGLGGGPGDPHRSLVIGGARGIGKTVLLTELEDLAITQGWVVLRATGREDTVDTLVHSTIPAKINELDPPATRTLTGIGIAGLGRIESDITDHTEPVPTLGLRLRELLALLDTGVLITIDEVQDADPETLSRLAVTYQDLVRDEANVALIMAGLTPGIGRLLDLPGTTFLRRARRYELGPLQDEDVARVLQQTASDAGKPFVDVAPAVDIASGYPYLVQLVGYLAFNRAADTITVADVEAVREECVETMGTQVHHPSLKDVPAAQLAYLRAMADLGEETVSTSDVAEELGKAPNATTDTRGKLVDRGLIEVAGWGKVRFALPYLADFLRGGGRLTKIS